MVTTSSSISLELSVKVKAPAMTQSGAEEHWTGPGKLTVTTDRLSLISKGFMSNGAAMEIPWTVVRELKNEITNRARFSAVINNLKLTFIITEGDKGALDSILKSLPWETRAQMCPKCGGAVRDDICQSCGINPKAWLRRRGLIILGSGLAMFILGVGFALAGEYLSTIMGWGSYAIPGGLIMIGLGNALYGIVKIITGTIY